MTANEEIEDTEVAIVTFHFQKTNNKSFSNSEKEKCIQETRTILNEQFRNKSLGVDQFKVRYLDDGDGSFWVEFGICVIWGVSFCGGIAQTLHLFGVLFEKTGKILLASGMNFQRLAWRLTSGSGISQNERRPGCYGNMKELDLRTKRCKKCDFRDDCVKLK